MIEPFGSWCSQERSVIKYALVARLAHAQCQEVVWMDADLQHPSTLIMEMIRLWQDGDDVVFAPR